MTSDEMDKAAQNRLNLGCGHRYLPDWVNLDFTKTGEGVQAWDLAKGIPYADRNFDIVYTSHVLEHLPREAGEFFIRECYRVLHPGGVVRVVVPDLEQIVREYLTNLEGVRSGDESAAARYAWSVLELLDQTVRNEPGGEMARYWRQETIPAESYVMRRVGEEFLEYRRSLSRPGSAQKDTSSTNGRKAPLVRVLKTKLLAWMTRDPKVLEHLRVGRFRVGGEPHRWMYDEHSLSELLRASGFTQVTRTNAFSSRISGWGEYQWLDVEGGGVRKPDSLFMEGIR